MYFWHYNDTFKRKKKKAQLIGSYIKLKLVTEYGALYYCGIFS